MSAPGKTDDSITAVQASKPPFIWKHNGWEIWKWTGWKGNKYVASDDAEDCLTCSKPIKEGDATSRDIACQGERHWTCAYPDDPPERLLGQWLAIKGRGTINQRHAAVMVGAPAELDCEYQRGQSFDVGEEALVTELTPESERARFIEEGLTRMFALIDRLESK